MKRRGLVFNASSLKKLGARPPKDNDSSLPASRKGEDISIYGEIIARKRKIKEKGMNKTEKEFSEILEEAFQRGEILRWQFEEVTLKIAPSTRYIPDFVAVMPNGNWQVFEIKGHLEDDAAVKFKAAAEKYPEISFHMLKKKKGQWITVYNLPSRLNFTNHKMGKNSRLSRLTSKAKKQRNDK
jgi:hypothetical protein